MNSATATGCSHKSTGSPGVVRTQAHAAQCTHSVLFLSAAWANLCVGLTNAVFVVVQRWAETRPQLNKGSFGLSGELLFFFAYCWRENANNSICFCCLDGPSYRCGVDFLGGGGSVCYGSNLLEFSNLRDGEHLEGLLHVPWLLVSADNWEGWVLRLEAGGKKLGTKHLQVLPHHHNFSLHVQVIDRWHHEAARCDVNGGVLDGLKLFNRARTFGRGTVRRVTVRRKKKC